MATYQVTRSCGHDERVRCAPRLASDEYFAMQERELCRDCQQAAQDAAYAATANTPERAAHEAEVADEARRWADWDAR